MTFMLFHFEDDMNSTTVNNPGYVFWWKYSLSADCKVFAWFLGGEFTNTLDWR